MSPPVVERSNVVKAVFWANVVALGFALALVSGMVAGPVWGDEGPKTTAKKILYLANPYGFSSQQRDGPFRALVEALCFFRLSDRDLGLFSRV